MGIKVNALEKLDRECGAVPVECGDGDDVTHGDAGVGQAAGEGADALHELSAGPPPESRDGDQRVSPDGLDAAEAVADVASRARGHASRCGSGSLTSPSLLAITVRSLSSKPSYSSGPELVNVGQKQAALQALHDLITSKRYKAWQKTLERIMFKYVELCVDMRKGRFAKDGLIQYRITCQQVNVSSLEEVIKYFMQLSTEKAEQARTQAQALEDALDVEDLEVDKRPEDLMLSYVSGEKGKDRSDRELVTPWFKFLWETYRTVLEILRNNSKLESLYAVSHLVFPLTNFTGSLCCHT
ncbi:hypothetical protein BHE74_00031126 [Ensete ventricosum]|nr:hypothetical protein BHE74_00031126 [Ensete ventricosum]